jgi:hypothetical protein
VLVAATAAKIGWWLALLRVSVYATVVQIGWCCTWCLGQVPIDRRASFGSAANLHGRSSLVWDVVPCYTPIQHNLCATQQVVLHCRGSAPCQIWRSHTTALHDVSSHSSSCRLHLCAGHSATSTVFVLGLQRWVWSLAHSVEGAEAQSSTAEELRRCCCFQRN